jgi:hypothetical protein
MEGLEKIREWRKQHAEALLLLPNALHMACKLAADELYAEIRVDNGVWMSEKRIAAIIYKHMREQREL